MENSACSMTIDVSVITETLKKVSKLEKIGGYSKAYDFLNNLWSGKVNFSKKNGLPAEVFGELLLRTGATSGYAGRNVNKINQYSVLKKARNIFIKLNNKEKIAECENYLAFYCYKKGDFEGAHEWLNESSIHRIEKNSESRIHTHLLKSIILNLESKYDETVTYLNSFKRNFDDTTYLFKGCFGTNIGVAYKNIEQPNQAIASYNLARNYHQKSHHLIYLATVENNLAQLYKSKYEFQKALKLIDNAHYVFNELGDHGRAAFSLDTKAQILITSGDFDLAEKLADEAIKNLQGEDDYYMLQDVILTKQIAASYSNKKNESSLIWHTIKESFGERIYNETLEITNRSKIANQKTSIINGNIKLSLPQEISNKQKFFGVWMQNDLFEALGLKKGFLAVGVICETKNGDFVAACEKETDLVTLGFLDNSFGLVCLENDLSEPELFDEKDVFIMGKIIGYCKPVLNQFGEYIVNLISC